MKTKFIVTVDIPKQSSKREVREYISDALNAWWGQMEPPNAYGADTNTPGDPLWKLPHITVSYAPKEK